MRSGNTPSYFTAIEENIPRPQCIMYENIH